MPDWPLYDTTTYETAGANTAASRGTSITANASGNTKGSYTQLIASTSYDTVGVLVMLDDLAAGIDYLLDIAIGAGGSEQIILPDLYAGGGTGSIAYGAQYWFPIAIPAGSRIAARCQASTGSSVIRVSCLLAAAGFMPPAPLSRVTAYGANSADSGGVSVDPGGSANTKGSYSQIVASTTNDIKGLIIAIGNQLNNVRSSQSWLIDLAIGGAGSEQIVIANYALNCSTSPDIVVPQTSDFLPLCIPAGTRLAVRAQSDGTDATDRLFDAFVYGCD